MKLLYKLKNIKFSRCIIALPTTINIFVYHICAFLIVDIVIVNPLA